MAFNHGYSDIQHYYNMRTKFRIQLRKEQKIIFCIVLVSLRVSFTEFLGLGAISLLYQKETYKCIFEPTLTIQFKLFITLQKCSLHEFLGQISFSSQDQVYNSSMEHLVCFYLKCTINKQSDNILLFALAAEKLRLNTLHSSSKSTGINRMYLMFQYPSQFYLASFQPLTLLKNIYSL